MKYISRLLVISSLFLSIGMYAQELENNSLITIDGNDFDAGTFIKFYFKNIDIVQDEDQKDIDNYLDLYIDYRLKLQEAYALGLDKKDSYIKEIESTRASLAQSYLTDNEVSEQLVLEAFNRSQKEVNASHILVKLDRAAAPADTLSAYNRIYDIYKELQEGALFANLARTKSEGPSAGKNGELGWFGSFRMVYDFESAAFETEVGKFSEPFRTDFGYHIVYVNETRPNPGEVTVAHIMTFDKEGGKNNTAEERINEVYKQLKLGKEFEQLAKEFSDDANSAVRGGKLNRFGTGGIDETFASVAFALENKGEYSKPVKTKFGWHIIRLLEKHASKTYDEQKKELEDKIQKSPRSRKITESFTNKLKKKYSLDKEMNLPKEVYGSVNDSLLSTGSYVYKSTVAGKKLFTINEKTYKTEDFLKYTEKRQAKDRNAYAGHKEKLDAFYQNFINEKLLEYYDNNLERDNPDFKFLYNEFKEGFLVFDLIETKIWNKAKEDTLGQQRFYNQNKENYMWKRRLDLILTQSISEEVANQVRQQLINNIPTDSIKSNLNDGSKTKVIISSGTVEESYNRLPANFDVKLGVSQVYHEKGDSFFKVIDVKEITLPKLKSFEEASGSVMSDYQQQLEKDWLDNLRNGHKIKVSKKILKQVKSKIKSELDK